MICLIAIFGIVSFAAPVTMMNFTASLGLNGISGDYAYQAYASSSGEDKLSYLVRAFEISVESGSNRIARTRFEELFGEEGSERRAEFESYCVEWGQLEFPDGTDDQVADAFKGYSYRGYLCGQAAAVYYRLAKEETDRVAALDFAFAQTPALDCDNSPVFYLAVEGAKEDDAEFCAEIYQRLRQAGYEQNEAYTRIETVLYSCKNFEKVLNERSVMI